MDLGTVLQYFENLHLKQNSNFGAVKECIGPASPLLWWVISSATSLLVNTGNSAAGRPSHWRSVPPPAPLPVPTRFSWGAIRLYTSVSPFTLFCLRNVTVVGHERQFLESLILKFVYINPRASGKMQGDLYFFVCWFPTRPPHLMSSAPFWDQTIYHVSLKNNT